MASPLIAHGGSYRGVWGWGRGRRRRAPSPVDSSASPLASLNGAGADPFLCGSGSDGPSPSPGGRVHGVAADSAFHPVAARRRAAVAPLARDLASPAPSLTYSPPLGIPRAVRICWTDRARPCALPPSGWQAYPTRAGHLCSRALSQQRTGMGPYLLWNLN
jgi:hypothetical protein